MPNLQTKDGETVADGLTSDELHKLKEMGVEFDLSESDGDGDAETERPGTGDGTTDDSPLDGDETDGDGEGAESPSEESGAETGDGPGDPLDPEEADVDPDTGDADSPGAPDGTGGDPDDAPGDDPGYEDGGEALTPGDGKVSPDREMADEFKDRDRDEMLENLFDVDMDSVREPDERDRARWASLVNQLAEYGKNIPRRKRERDSRIGSKRVKMESGQIRKEVNNSGAIRELQQEFQKLVSRPTPRPARAGPQIDMENVTRKAAGDVTIDQLFEEDVVVETGDRVVGLSTDISGSMGSDMIELKKAGAVIAEATGIIGDDFVWNAFTDEGHGGLDLRIVTGPHEDFRWEHLDSFTSASNEPTAAGIRDCRMLMERTSKRQKVLIVITDGKALVGEDGTFYGGHSNVPVEQAREAVRECRRSGIDVIGLGIGGMSDTKMKETFGDGNYRLTNIDDLPEDILELYEEQMNVSRDQRR